MFYSRIIFRQSKILLLIIGIFIILCFINVNSGNLLNVIMGIRPRNFWGFIAIPFAPFVHNSWTHLIKNLIPFIIFGTIVSTRGNLIKIMVITVIVGGLNTWLFSNSNSITVGSSMLVYGFFGFTLFYGIFQKNFLWFVIGIITLYMSNTLIEGMVSLNNNNPAWLVHSSSFVGGAFSATCSNLED